MNIQINGYLQNKALNKTYMYDLKGQKQDNIIDYTEKDGTRIHLIIEKNQISFVKENKESKLSLNFILNQQSQGIYELKMFDSHLNLLCETTDLIIEDDHFIVKYILNISENQRDKYEYSIRYTLI